MKGESMNVRDRMIYEGVMRILLNPTLSSISLKTLKEMIKKVIAESDSSGIPYMGEIKLQFLVAALEQSVKNIQKGWFSTEYAKRVAETLVRNPLSDQRKEIRKAYLEKYGIESPGFCVVSPTQHCNLNCTGCYAASSGKTPATLDYEVFRRLTREMHDIIGARFMVISGGEPLLYKSNGKDLFDILEGFKDMFFLFYTNGTLLNDETVARMLDLGNITPAISVEGYEKETDARRGKGIYARIMDSMERLRSSGVPFGISVTATSKNVHILLEDRFYDYYFDELGATYMWMFHLMPIGRAKDTMDLMISPRQRVALYHKFEKMLFEKKRFVGDFWNSAGASNGCIAYGRPGGFFYVDWNGNIPPCAFIPYYKDNIYDLYANGKTIVDALMSDFFAKGREWQSKYGFKQQTKHTHHETTPKNWLAPCSGRDHYKYLRENILNDSLKPEDENAAAALKDPEYYKRLVEFDEELEKLTQPLWQTKYLGSIKKRPLSSRAQKEESFPAS
jgi:MoaA/NifB/PqqE/SkfB family radical SAM enzyme